MSSEEKNTQSADKRGDWITYRPELKLLDCTVRDGGLMNNHQLADEFARGVYEALAEAGIDYMEVGYKGSKEIYPPDEYGPWKHCDEDDLRRVYGDNPADIKLSAMADAERSDYENDIVPCEESVLDTIRVACYVHQIPTAMKMMQDAHEKGYEVISQLMAVHNIRDAELEGALNTLVQSPAVTIYIVDSWGCLYSEQTQELMKKYLQYCEEEGKTVGFHGHNNQQLAYANTIEAIIYGANQVDGTMYGMGRGAGNCPLENLVGFLHNPKFRLRPIIKCIQEYVKPLQEKLGWGPDIPYMLTGQLHQHPRSAMKHLESEHKEDYVRFYDQVMEEE
ncbi:MAG: aldolase catalytic domain-containing protein [Planctomycetes bacterium]|nr:aldolase catalytic domain-containing protein [Planctomycetota bacterium]